MPKRSKSSERWLQRQRKDYFVRKAQDGGQVSRAHYKLAQIDQRFHILSARKKVLELGAAPGGWTQYLESKITRGFLIAVDPLPITRGGRCRVVEGYAGESEVNEQIIELLQGQKLDLVLSDMAPSISGIRAVDQARAMELADVALQACEDWLIQGGDLAIKAFQGEGLDPWVADLKKQFGRVNMMKPKASRPESREVFVVARDFNAEGQS